MILKVFCFVNFSDPNSILGGVRLPPDTEIIKYTSSIVGPKIPGTTNRGRKKTISLDPPSVSVHPTHSSTGMLIERSGKRPKLNVIFLIYKNTTFQYIKIIFRISRMQVYRLIHQVIELK